jgi:hypothetical protein
MTIQNTLKTDLQDVFRLYKHATELQNQKGAVPWPTFERNLIEEEIQNRHQWKFTTENTLACVWSTTFEDPLIWKEKNQDPSVYIHRIATNPIYKGNNYVRKILLWAKEYAVQNNKEFIRMDTVGENLGLINHYKNCGFQFLGLSKLEETRGLPSHYQNATVSLFEYKI